MGESVAARVARALRDRLDGGAWPAPVELGSGYRVMFVPAHPNFLVLEVPGGALTCGVFLDLRELLGRDEEGLLWSALATDSRVGIARAFRLGDLSYEVRGESLGSFAVRVGEAALLVSVVPRVLASLWEGIAVYANRRGDPASPLTPVPMCEETVL